MDMAIVRNGTLLREEHAAELVKPITEDEIKNSLFSIGDDKSPGPDGYTSCFFKRAWNIVGQDFNEAIMEFFQAGQLLKQVNHTALTLIPKSKDVSKVENFRPIACCNVIYKVISKIISSRLSQSLVDIINPAQAAFIKGRSMAENVFLLQEMLRQYGRKRSSPRCILNIDIKKAFDSVDWTFILDLLAGLNFPLAFIKWIKACISTPSYSLIINGSMHGFFKGKRGLRQGDPLSPYLFVLCLEYLSRGLSQLKQNADFNFHPKCGGIKITHLAFADDLILLSRGDLKSVSMLMDKLEHFGRVSGLKSSLSKSTVLAAGIKRDELEDILSITGFKQGCFPFRYLGIPVADIRLSVSQYSPLIGKISDYINSWAGTNLSYAGRLELINSVLQGVDCFWLSILPVPKGVLDRIMQLCRYFLWSGKCKTYIKPLVSWKECTLPKGEGGLGIMELRTWNKALLARTLWNIHAKKDSLWIQWMHHSYLRKYSIWEYQIKRGDSPLIKHIAALRDKLLTTEGSVMAASRKLELWAAHGTFQTKEAYDYFRFKVHPPKWPRIIWRSGNLPKHAFILWLGAKGKLLTRDKLKEQINDQQCILCNAEMETVDHLFFQCSYVKQVWNQIKYWLQLKGELSTIKAAIKALIKFSKGTGIQAKARKIGLACTIHVLWEARNQKIFEGKAPTPSSIIQKIQTQVYGIMYKLFPSMIDPHM